MTAIKPLVRPEPMPHPELIERVSHIEVHSPMRPGLRVALALLALVPLLAPYELLLRVPWRQSMHPAFFVAVLVSAGALVVSAILLFAAIAGLSSTMLFDKRSGTFAYAAGSPVLRRSARTLPLSAIREVEIGVRDWSDGAPTYHLRVSFTDGTAFESGSSTSRDEIELIRSRVAQFLA